MSEYDLGKFPGPKAGEPAVDFTLSTPDGKEVKLEDYKGKWVVIETGSITCSMYVKNVGGFAKLRQKYPDVEFLLVYVREAHPGSRLGAHISDKQKRKMSLDMKDIYIYKPYLMPITKYKLKDLEEIAKEEDISLNGTTGKKKLKKQLYDDINLKHYTQDI